MTGDLTSAFRTGPPVTKAPRLPLTSDSTATAPVGPLFAGAPVPDGACTSAELIGAGQATVPFAVAKHQKMPTQARASLTPI